MSKGIDFGAALNGGKKDPDSGFHANAPIMEPEVLDDGAIVIAEKLDPEPYRKQFDVYEVEIVDLSTQANALIVDSDESAEKATGMANQAKGLIKKLEGARKIIIGPFKKFTSAIDSFAKGYRDQLEGVPEILRPKVTEYNKQMRLKAEAEAEVARKEAAELQAKLDREAEEKNRLVREKAEAEARAKAEEEARIAAEEEAKRAEERAVKAEEEARKQAKNKKEAEKAAAIARVKAEKQAKETAEKAEIEARKIADEAAEQARIEAENNKIEAARVAPVIVESRDTIKTASGSAKTKLKWTFELEDIKKVPAEYILLDEKKIKHLIEAGFREIAGIRIFQADVTTFRKK